ncbi:MAG: shikimate dehydrogenase [Saprospiraceae bacterium]|nr:shikimate dehydrogenase [Saprospiraceae bacterium]
MKHLGLIGYPLGHSFSKSYFNNKFKALGVDNEWFYDTYPIENIEKFTDLLKGQPDLVGLNVTIPYKQEVIPFVDKLDKSASEVGAINCIRIENGILVGYNTDVYGFEKSLIDMLVDGNIDTLPQLSLKALVLGTGGASKAVAYVMKKLNIPFHYVSRNRTPESLSYKDVNAEILATHHLIINGTPLGMSPNTEGCPPLPYENIGNQHFLYDLVYNPEVTEFMKRGIVQGAKVKNGYDMLLYQAEKGWEIWNQ